jgi:hypothetical protein
MISASPRERPGYLAEVELLPLSAKQFLDPCCRQDEELERSRGRAFNLCQLGNEGGHLGDRQRLMVRDLGELLPLLQNV